MRSADAHRVVETRLAELAQRYTPNRRRIVGALMAAPSPQTLPELLRKVPALTQSSTYRNLAVLADAGVVRRIVHGGDHAHYELGEDLSAHHHHLVCVGCGTIADVVPFVRRRPR